MGAVDFLLGTPLIVFGAPLVGIAGRVIEISGREGLGKALGVGGCPAVLAVAGWLIIGSF
ncbi:hypothetical protein ACF1A5_26555 [Streptomyces sp. NPDC014864]|uniref:hypothetical protein n=1 Tax=Streptomyces sp. NPDC014864 TaxID=3364924 RepID=UPI0036FB51AF